VAAGDSEAVVIADRPEWPRRPRMDEDRRDV